MWKFLWLLVLAGIALSQPSPLGLKLGESDYEDVVTAMEKVRPSRVEKKSARVALLNVSGQYEVSVLHKDIKLESRFLKVLTPPDLRDVVGYDISPFGKGSKLIVTLYKGKVFEVLYLIPITVNNMRLVERAVNTLYSKYSLYGFISPDLFWDRLRQAQEPGYVQWKELYSLRLCNSFLYMNLFNDGPLLSYTHKNQAKK